MATVVVLNSIPATPPTQITFLRLQVQPIRTRNSANFITCLKFNTPSKSSFLRASSSDQEEDSNNSETTLQEHGEVEHDIGVKAALSILTFYKTQISPILPRSCRYVPTCSEYSMEAYKRYGFFKGSTLTLYRICRCNPLGGSGYDPPIWFGEIRPPPPPEEEQLDDDHNS
jgi:putative membrane protein insertion efficiency factor